MKFLFLNSRPALKIHCSLKVENISKTFMTVAPASLKKKSLEVARNENGGKRRKIIFLNPSFERRASDVYTWKWIDKSQQQQQQPTKSELMISISNETRKI